ncbi:Mu transposase C-terminal domain-containing protein [Aliagarivorans taiwanensis]|uniref:Mu transposase C-terminal domain-containing protein n=1 Tax=Aliagarivorans taiwanensis TaxID=561966 RepID=UPI00041D1ED7|nr:Mu transposase C-terminal domain-containing protein [Aliagarivorans taiwanensis]
MIYQSLQISSNDGEIDLLVCHVHFSRQLAAVVDLKVIEGRSNLPKPKIWKFNELTKLIKQKGYTTQQFSYPAEMSFSDRELKEQKRQTWVAKRDEKHRRLAPLTSDALINQYLYGDGIADEVMFLVAENIRSDDESAWKTKGAYYSALNRYITFGCTINALLPVRLKACGSNYLHIDKPGPNNVKRGRGGKDNRNSRSKSMGVTKLHKKALRQVVAFVKKTCSKFTYAKAIEVYQLNFENHIVEREIEGEVHRTYVPFKEHECLSDEQVYYHLKQIFTKAEYLKIKYGNLVYEKDYADRQGSAHDGVIGATHRYEIDATILDVYVRYPYDTTGQYTMGRPVLYLVVDVASTMYVGFYLGFDGPCWQGAAQALVNACMDKKEFCARFGVPPEDVNWPAAHIPVQVTIDNGPEYKDGLIQSILRSELGIRAFNFTAVFRGDAKGCVERAFGVLNGVIHFIAGAIPKLVGRDEQHPSNRAEYDLDALHRLIYEEIVFRNNSAERISKMDINAIRANIDITPQALFLHSLKQEMNGGRPSKDVEPGRVRWAFLPEETAYVRGNGVYFEGLVYHSDFANQAGWYTKAKHHGAFKIVVKRTKDWTSQIWHKTSEGEYVCLHLKNVNDESPFLDMHWEPLLHLLEQFKDKKHQNRLNKKRMAAFKQGIIDRIEALNQEQLSGTPENSRKSIQPGIKSRQLFQKTLEKMLHAVELHAALMDETTSEAPEQNLPDDLDKKLF